MKAGGDWTPYVLKFADMKGNRDGEPPLPRRTWWTI